MVVITTDWSPKNAPIHQLEKRWLCLSENAMADGQWLNEYVVIRDGPILTNNLTVVPSGEIEKLGLANVLESRILQCKT